MAQVTRRSGRGREPAFIVKLKRELRDQLAVVGITNAKVDAEPIPGTKLFRFRVVAARFEKLRHFERQDLVWRIVEQTLERDQRLFVSVVQTWTPAEESGELAA